MGGGASIRSQHGLNSELWDSIVHYRTFYVVADYTATYVTVQHTRTGDASRRMGRDKCVISGQTFEYLPKFPRQTLMRLDSVAGHSSSRAGQIVYDGTHQY